MKKSNGLSFAPGLLREPENCADTGSLAHRTLAPALLGHDVLISALILLFNFYPTTLLSVMGKRERFNYSVFKSLSLNPK